MANRIIHNKDKNLITNIINQNYNINTNTNENVQNKNLNRIVIISIR